jgi:hypothetical protein
MLMDKSMYKMRTFLGESIPHMLSSSVASPRLEALALAFPCPKWCIEA